MTCLLSLASLYLKLYVIDLQQSLLCEINLEKLNRQIVPVGKI